MNTKFREIERKWLVVDQGKFAYYSAKLLELFATEARIRPGAGNILRAETIDTYWKCPGQGDFIRLRHSWGEDDSGAKRSLKEMTLKQKDKTSNYDRLEADTGVESVSTARVIFTRGLGIPAGEIRKVEELVLWVDSSTAVISLSRLSDGRMYIEIEADKKWNVSYATKKRKVAQCSLELVDLLPTLQVERRSLFEIYIEPSQVRLENLRPKYSCT